MKTITSAIYEMTSNSSMNAQLRIEFDINRDLWIAKIVDANDESYPLFASDGETSMYVARETPAAAIDALAEICAIEM